MFLPCLLLHVELPADFLERSLDILAEVPAQYGHVGAAGLEGVDTEALPRLVLGDGVYGAAGAYSGAGSEDARRTARREGLGEVFLRATKSEGHGLVAPLHSLALDEQLQFAVGDGDTRTVR